MNVLMTGASGLIGRALIRAFTPEEYRVRALSRSPEKNRLKYAMPSVEWQPWPRTDEAWRRVLNDIHGVIHLAGAPILGGMWTARRRRILYNSRVDTTRRLILAVKRFTPHLSFYIQASAIGYYPLNSDETWHENGVNGTGFLAGLVRDWEAAAHPLNDPSIRTAFMRLGMVLAADSRVVRLMKPPFLMGLGGPVGSGRQMISWIHIDDVVEAFRHVMQREESHGIYNLTAPRPVSMDEFCREFGRQLHRPPWLRTPAWLPSLLPGNMARETFLSGQKVRPAHLLDESFHFKYQQIETALYDIVNNRGTFV